MKKDIARRHNSRGADFSLARRENFVKPHPRPNRQTTTSGGATTTTTPTCGGFARLAARIALLETYQAQTTSPARNGAVWVGVGCGAVWVWCGFGCTFFQTHYTKEFTCTGKTEGKHKQGKKKKRKEENLCAFGGGDTDKGYWLWNLEIRKSTKMVRKRRNIAITGM